MKVRVTLLDEIEADTMEEVYAMMIEWMQVCAEMRDVTAFKFEPLEDE